MSYFKKKNFTFVQHWVVNDTNVKEADSIKTLKPD